MEKIYAPWRSSYITDTAHKSNNERLNNKCIFCHNLKQNNDEKYFILKRLKHSFVMLNCYPYNGGHLMILPLKHKSELSDLLPQARIEMIEITNTSINILKEELQPQGFNIGINIGKAGGGGIPTHLHIHLLPRWEGDVNFMPLLCNTKPISIDLKKLYKQLKKKFNKIQINLN